MNKIIKNIPTILFFYSGVLGLLFLCLYLLFRDISESFTVTFMFGIYGGMCFFTCEAWLIPFLPVLVMTVILVFLSVFLTKHNDFIMIPICDENSTNVVSSTCN